MSSEKTIYAVKAYAKGREIRSKARDFPGLFWAIFYAEKATPKGGGGFATWSAGTVSG